MRECSRCGREFDSDIYTKADELYRQAAQTRIGKLVLIETFKDGFCPDCRKEMGERAVEQIMEVVNGEET